MSKQYLLLCDETGMEMLKGFLLPEAIQFLEVQGMPMHGSPHNVMVTPVLPPLNQMPIPTLPTAPPAVEE